MAGEITKPITVYQLGLDAHNAYAERTALAEQVSKQFPPGELSSISSSVRIDTVTPQLPELELLIGNAAVMTPWATFETPDTLYGKHRKHRVPFGISNLLPSLGSHEHCVSLQQTVLAHPCKNPEEERERHSLDNFFGMLQKLNTWLNDVFNRIHQFMHG